MKYGPLRLESLLPWKLKLLTSPQGHFSDILIVFPRVCVRVCARVCFLWAFFFSFRALSAAKLEEQVD